MAKKKPAEEHENLERWLVSYADFMTLLFATFVVLYALAQSDVNSFKGIEEALKKAFTQSIFDSQTNIMDGSESMFSGKDGATNPLMLEYMSQKYEQSAFEEIKDSVEDLKKEGLSAEISEKGLVIRFNSKAISFVPGSAEIKAESVETIKQIAKIIKSKFSIHYIQVEGHTDSDTMSSSIYPSNWELSSARASSVVRFMIKNEDFNYKIFSVLGLADTVPIVPNTTPSNKAKNRRVEVVVLRNKYRDLSDKDIQKIMKEVQEKKRNKIIKKGHSEELEGHTGNDKELLKNVIDMSDRYSDETERINSLENQSYTFEEHRPQFMESNNE